jgi:hypothetical protein
LDLVGDPSGNGQQSDLGTLTQVIFHFIFLAARSRSWRAEFRQLAECTKIPYEICTLLPIDISPIICYNVDTEREVIPNEKIL